MGVNLGLVGAMTGLGQGMSDFGKLGMQNEFETMRAERLATFKQALEDNSWARERAAKLSDLKDARAYAEEQAAAQRQRKTDWKQIEGTTHWGNAEGETFDNKPTRDYGDMYAAQSLLQAQRDDARERAAEARDNRKMVHDARMAFAKGDMSPEEFANVLESVGGSMGGAAAGGPAAAVSGVRVKLNGQEYVVPKGTPEEMRAAAEKAAAAKMQKDVPAAPAAPSGGLLPAAADKPAVSKPKESTGLLNTTVTSATPAPANQTIVQPKDPKQRRPNTEQERTAQYAKQYADNEFQHLNAAEKLMWLDNYGKYLFPVWVEIQRANAVNEVNRGAGPAKTVGRTGR